VPPKGLTRFVPAYNRHTTFSAPHVLFEVNTPKKISSWEVQYFGRGYSPFGENTWRLERRELILNVR